MCVIASVFFLYKTFIRPDSIHTWHFGGSRIRAAPIHRFVLKESRIMILDGSSMTSMASMQTAVSVPTAMTTLELATPNSVVTNLGFIMSLCMMEHCFLRYSENNIKIIRIRNNYNITKVPANAFLGATYIGVSMSYKTTISHSDFFIPGIRPLSRCHLTSKRIPIIWIWEPVYSWTKVYRINFQQAVEPTGMNSFGIHWIRN